MASCYCVGLGVSPLNRDGDPAVITEIEVSLIFEHGSYTECDLPQIDVLVMIDIRPSRPAPNLPSFVDVTT